MCIILFYNRTITYNRQQMKRRSNYPLLQIVNFTIRFLSIFFYSKILIQKCDRKFIDNQVNNNWKAGQENLEVNWIRWNKGNWRFQSYWRYIALQIFMRLSRSILSNWFVINSSEQTKWMNEPRLTMFWWLGQPSIKIKFQKMLGRVLIF